MSTKQELISRGYKFVRYITQEDDEDGVGPGPGNTYRTPDGRWVTEYQAGLAAGLTVKGNQNG